MTGITISKEKECETLWRFITPVSGNMTSLASVLAKTREIIDGHYERLTNVDGEPDWKEVSMMLFGTVDGFMDYVRGFCLAYTELIQGLRETLGVSEETDEEDE